MMKNFTEVPLLQLAVLAPLIRQASAAWYGGSSYRFMLALRPGAVKENAELGMPRHAVKKIKYCKCLTSQAGLQTIGHFHGNFGVTINKAVQIICRSVVILLG